MELRLDDTGFGGLEIFQQPEEFCYGIDAVLLAGFAVAGAAAKGAGKVSGDGAVRPYSSAGLNFRIMDLGTGTGIIPLILSHKTEAGYIGGVEIQENSFRLAEKNAAHNCLSDRLHFFHRDVFDFAAEGTEEESLCGQFDLVTSNPPYTAGNCGIESANRAKAIARHETSATLSDFIATASRLLKFRGDFYMVHRPSRLADICESCRKYGLEPKEMCFVSGKPMEKPNILLVHCVKGGNSELRILKPLSVHTENGDYSEEILKLYEKR